MTGREGGSKREREGEEREKERERERDYSVFFQVLEKLRGVPFLVNLYYAFQTDTKLHIVMGE